MDKREELRGLLAKRNALLFKAQGNVQWPEETDEANEALRVLEYEYKDEVFDALPSILDALDAAETALKAVAGNENAGEYETEYDGRTETLCLGCDYQAGHRPHGDTCKYKIAHAVLATIHQLTGSKP